MFSVETLPDDPAVLKSLFLERSSYYQEQILQREEKIKLRDQRIHWLEEYLLRLKRQQFGRKAETFISPDQLKLIDTPNFFDEIETTVVEQQEVATETITYDRKRGKCTRKPWPENIQVEERRVELPQEQRICPHDGAELKECGQEVTEQLEVIPASVKLVRHVKVKYECPCCEHHSKGVMLPQPVPKSIASASLLSFLMVSKFVDHLPFYRLEKIFGNLGLDISRGNMARWMVQVTQTHLMPLINLMWDTLLDSGYIAADETPVQVLKGTGKPATSKSYMWVMAHRGPDDPPVILYEYDPSRGSHVPSRLLEDYSGYLQTDGYSGYNPLTHNQRIKLVGCMAHARRRFFEAAQTTKGKGVGQKGLNLIQDLYRIERTIKDALPEERLAVRQAKSSVVMSKLREFLDTELPKVPPKTTAGSALHYLHTFWPRLTVFLEDGRLEIDNNYVENKIRPFALGRKNWIFSDTVEGAKASAIIYSLVETAKANNLHVFDYLKHVLTYAPGAQSLADYEKLLPWNVPLPKRE